MIVNIHGGPEGQSRPDFIGRNNYLVDELGVALLGFTRNGHANVYSHKERVTFDR